MKHCIIIIYPVLSMFENKSHPMFCMHTPLTIEKITNGPMIISSTATLNSAYVIGIRVCV